MKINQHNIALLLALSLSGLCPITSYGLTLHVTDDTNSNLSNPRQINGASPSVLVRNVGRGGVRQGFVRFDLSPLTSDTVITKATLRLWVNTIPIPGSIDLHEVTSAWNEGSLNAATAPFIASPFATVPLSSASLKHYVTVDVTEVMLRWHDGTDPNFGLALVPNAGNPIRLALDSKEDTLTSHPMEIEVALEGPPGPKGDPGVTGPQGPSGQPGHRERVPPVLRDPSDQPGHRELLAH